MLKQLVILLLYCVLLVSACTNERELSTVINSPAQEVSFEFVPKSNGENLRLGSFYKLKDLDSIMITRLNFYISGITLNGTSKSLSFKEPFLYGNSNSVSKFMAKNDSIPIDISSLTFFCGLDSIANLSDPTSFILGDHPLSSSQNMYWTAWTKYRFVVCEGLIKTTDGSLLNFGFHTGSPYRYPTNINQKLNPDKMLKIEKKVILNIEKVFYPNSGQNILYKSGELQGHADFNDSVLTRKFALNFSQAFTIE